ncbi:hypothetical protein TSUD_285130 [Trifolium subterraneum]|uniref:Uncharacterized protein n=1 Tax=Trifolium subterraneum TaxID=3900 RepID=A0A2Z6NW74_TRISU|nr:hypothetical protein TSUD_285130 [Trifolium subterraneum]
MFKLAKLLHVRGFHITFVNTEYNQKRLLKSRGPNSLDGFIDFNFETIPDGLTPMSGDGDVTQDVHALRESIRNNFVYPFRELIARLHGSAISGLVPPITCLVSDVFMSFTTQLAEELSLPIVLLYTSSACSFLSSLHFQTLIEKGLIPFKELKEPRSVVYVNFGSITIMSPEKLLEFAWGLVNSKKPFLWIIRPDLVIGDSVVLSTKFADEILDRGFIASWCSQDKVLNHPSVGGFLTHCGWNSTTESICAGVPMLCWPFFGDQSTNCRFICNEWEIGIEIDTNVKREEVEKLVNELMVGEKGNEMRKKAMELKKKAEDDTKPGGRSYMNLDKVIKEVLLKQN